MDLRGDFEDLWKSDFKLPEPEPDYCAVALKFLQLIEKLKLESSFDAITVNQKKLVLQDRFHEYLVLLPEGHRNMADKGSSHICVWDLYLTAYYKLRNIELILLPPLLAAPPAPSPVTPPPIEVEIPGIYIGDELEEQEGKEE